MPGTALLPPPSTPTSQAGPPPEVLTPREAANFLQIHPRTLERKVAAGELPAPYRSGRLVRYSRTALQEFIQAGS
jgi:excisionase family DNA binding protein